MKKFNSGSLVKLKSGSPLMEVIMLSVTGEYVCGWYDGVEYCQVYHTEKELVNLWSTLIDIPSINVLVLSWE